MIVLNILGYLFRNKQNSYAALILGPAIGRYPIKFILPVCVLFRGKRGAVCGKRLTFLYTSPFEHVKYNV